MEEHPFPDKLTNRIIERKTLGNYRSLCQQNSALIDFSSNDYLGFAQREFSDIHFKDSNKTPLKTGSGGSRLLTGNTIFHEKLETQLAGYFNASSALMYNSGYMANVGLLSAVAQKNDVVFYDQLIHASLRDGIRLSHAKSYGFKHNSLENLEVKLKNAGNYDHAYVVTESVFSMDGDVSDLKKMSRFCEKNKLMLIVDEAHAVGVLGENGLGLVNQHGLEKQIWARVITFGKSLGTHGAAVLGSKKLIDYLINFSRTFIYTTALSAHHTQLISNALQALKNENAVSILRDKIAFFNQLKQSLELGSCFKPSISAIHSYIIPGNKNAKSMALFLQEHGFDVRAILSPTVSAGEERIRICLHCFNSNEEIKSLLNTIKTFNKTPI